MSGDFLKKFERNSEIDDIRITIHNKETLEFLKEDGDKDNLPVPEKTIIISRKRNITLNDLIIIISATGICILLYLLQQGSNNIF